jgi:Tol biopolymer transport system component
MSNSTLFDSLTLAASHKETAAVNRNLTTSTFVLAMLLAASASHAAVVGEVIASYDASIARTAVMSASNGGSFQSLICGGDLSYNGSPRYFIGSVPGTDRLPDTYLTSVLVASDEDCTQTAVIFSSASMRFSTMPHWSHDGSRVAVYAESWDLINNIIAESGIYVAQVTRDGTGRPAGISGLHKVIAAPAEMLISWSGDDQRIAYVASAADGEGGLQNDIWVYDLSSGTSSNATNSRGVNEDHPAFSPTEDRLAFIRRVAVRGSYRYDIFTQSASGGTVTQVTTKGTTGASQNLAPCFSPDGQYLAFSSGSSMMPLAEIDIYRIKADGSNKAVNLTGKRTGSFRNPTWRR